MTDLKNLLIWFGFDNDGEIDRITQLQAVNPNDDLEAYWEKWRVGGAHRAENVYTFTKEYIKVPYHLMGFETWGWIMHHNGERLRAITPYFVTIEEGK